MSWKEKFIRREKLKKIKQDKKQINSLGGYKKKLVEDRKELKFVFFDSKYTVLSLTALYIYQWYSIILPAMRAVDDFGIFQWVVCLKMPMIILTALMYSSSNYHNLLGLLERKEILNRGKAKSLSDLNN